MKKSLRLLIIPIFIVISCQKEEITPVTNTSAEKKANETLYELMQEWYLWNKNLPEVKATDYENPYVLIEVLRYKQYDRWSFVADFYEFMASMEGSFVGHGIRMGLDNDGKVRIVMIYKNSPLYSFGVRRGWIIKKLNDVELAPVFISGDANRYNQLMGPSTEGITNKFLFQTPEGKDSLIISTKKKFELNSVILDTTLNLSSGKTGYLVFNEFIEPSPRELKVAFAKFKQNDVKDLILDLRYNTGGILDVATQLASQIASQLESKVFIKTIFNDDKKNSENDTLYFMKMHPDSALNLTRLVVICTRETASASEVIINGLKPYINVICIGDTTNGKPTGMNVWGYQEKYIFAPVTFKMVNDEDFGDYYSGFPPDKYVTDDFTHDWADINELCFKEAVYYIENGSFSTKSIYPWTKSRYFAEKPSLMNNTFIINRQFLNIR